jgi:hypothetical protein
LVIKENLEAVGDVRVRMGAQMMRQEHTTKDAGRDYQTNSFLHGLYP